MGFNSSEALGYQQVTSLNTAAGLTVPAGARYALVQAETKDVRWRDDGTNPTSSVGMVLAAGTTLLLDSDLTSAKFIEVEASAKLNVSYYA